MILLSARQREEPRELDFGPGACEPVAQSGVLEGGGVDRSGGGDHRPQVGRQNRDLSGDAHPLVGEGAHRHHPPLALAAESALDRQRSVGEEHLVEHLLAGHVADRSRLDSRRLHVHDERGDPLVLGSSFDGGGVGAEQEEAPAGEMRGRDPDLLPVDDVVVAVPDCGGPQVGEVVARVGFRKALAPVLAGFEDRGQPARLLLLGPPGDDHRPDLPEAVRVVQTRRAVLGHHLRVDDPLHGGGRPASVLLRPVDGGPPPGVQEPLPRGSSLGRLLTGDRGFVGDLLARQEGRQVLVEPRAQFVAEGFVFGGKCEIHDPGG